MKIPPVVEESYCSVCNFRKKSKFLSTIFAYPCCFIIRLFIHGYYWNEDIEYILVDLPPGTGDVAIDIQSLI